MSPSGTIDTCGRAYDTSSLNNDTTGCRRSCALDGTNLPDLLGLRLCGRYTRENLQQWLPQLRNDQLVKWLGVDELRFADGPADDVVEAALAAAALDNLRRSTPMTIAVRRAVVEILGDRMTTTDLTAILSIRPRTLTWLRKRPVNHSLVHAIRLQLGARADLRDRHRAWNAGKTA